MRDRSIRIALGALLATSALASPAMAQIDPTIPVAPTRPAVDENGVDLIKGTYSLAQPEISIGEAGKGGLSYAHLWSADGWRDNVTATIVSDGNTYFVSIGDVSDKFTWNGSAFVGTEGNGTSLTGTPDDSTYTARDGTTYIFSRTTPDEGTYQPNLARIKRITYPTSERLAFVWVEAVGCQILSNPNCLNQIAPDFRKRARLQAVVSNLGYQLLFDYQMDAQPYSPSQLLGEWSRLIAVTAFNKPMPLRTHGWSLQI